MPGNVFIVIIIVFKLGGWIDRTCNRPIVCLVSIYPDYATYTFTERGTVKVRHFVNATVKLAYAQHTIIRYNIYNVVHNHLV